MNLIELRVRNFRSIEAEQHLPIPGRATLVGPNNSGKTNFLRAIQVLFTGTSNTYGYSRENDLTFGAGRSRTSITATFEGDETTEKEIYNSLDELHALQGTSRRSASFSLTLYFTETNTPVYSFFPNLKRPKLKAQAVQYSRTHTALVTRLLDMFRLHYVPSAKSVEQIYIDLISPFLRRKVAKVIEPHKQDIKNSLSEAANALNEELSIAGLDHFKASFSLPKQSVEEMVSGFDFVIADPQETPIHEKGMGVQTTALLAAFRWITRQEVEEGRKVIWLLEEPESYLHPHLANNCNTILDNLAEDAIVIKTTHAMAFVPQDPKFVCGTSLDMNNHTIVSRYATFSEAVSAIRSSLGIKFSDFYNLDQYNVLLEGPSDREIFQWVVKHLPEDRFPLPTLRKAKFEDFGGVKHLAGFLRATYQFIRTEKACVAVFDGDDAGERERRALQGYFGNKDIPFESNTHFVSVRSRFAIEGLFPDQWIIDINHEHPDWFEDFAVDAAGELEPFRVKDSKKPSIKSSLLGRAENEPDLTWSDRFVRVCNAIDEALQKCKESLT